MQFAYEDLVSEVESIQDAPSSLMSILDPSAAMDAAQRMQRWYRNSSFGAGKSFFGRDGRKIEGSLPAESADDEA